MYIVFLSNQDVNFCSRNGKSSSAICNCSSIVVEKVLVPYAKAGVVAIKLTVANATSAAVVEKVPVPYATRAALWRRYNRNCVSNFESLWQQKKEVCKAGRGMEKVPVPYATSAAL